MADYNTPLEFISEAQEELNSFNKTYEQYIVDEKTRKETEKKLNIAQNRLENEKKQAVEKKKKEIETEYTKQIKQIDDEIRKIAREKESAREKAVKERIETETNPQRQRIEQLTKDFNETLTKDNVPWYAKNKVFFAIFYPDTLLEALASAAVFILAFILLPIILWKMFLGNDTTSFIVLNAIVVCLDMLITVAVLKNTREKHAAAMKQARKALDEIRKEKQEIRKLTDSIQKDKNDSLYDLKSYEEAATAKKEEKKQLESNKVKALDTFEKVTSGEIAKEIEDSYKNEMEKMKTEISALDEKCSLSKQEIEQKKEQISTKYYEHFGQKYTNSEDLEKIKMIIMAGNAATIKEAIEKYEEND